MTSLQVAWLHRGRTRTSPRASSVVSRTEFKTSGATLTRLFAVASACPRQWCSPALLDRLRSPRSKPPPLLLLRPLCLQRRPGLACASRRRICACSSGRRTRLRGSLRRSWRPSTSPPREESPSSPLVLPQPAARHLRAPLLSPQATPAQPGEKTIPKCTHPRLLLPLLRAARHSSRVRWLERSSFFSTTTRNAGRRARATGCVPGACRGGTTCGRGRTRRTLTASRGTYADSRGLWYCLAAARAASRI